MSDKKSPQKNRRSWSDRWFDWRSRRSFEGNRNKSKRLVVTEDSAGKAPSSDYTEVDTNLPPDLIVPAHIGIIMDGNGRWAQRRGFERSYGHRAGAENLKRVTEACSMIGVKYLTVYAFSTENWKRPTAEVSQLMQLFVEFFRKYDAELEANNIRLRFTGRIQELPQAVQDTINEAESGSFARTGMQLIIAFNYGGRQEIIDAAQRIAAAVEAGKISANEVDEALVTKHLYMPDVPDPDLIIRSSGEMRISNFLLWESAYAEFWVSDVLWPDFDRATLYKALYDFNGRERRFGGV